MRPHKTCVCVFVVCVRVRRVIFTMSIVCAVWNLLPHVCEPKSPPQQWRPENGHSHYEKPAIGWRFWGHHCSRCAYNLLNAGVGVVLCGYADRTHNTFARRINLYIMERTANYTRTLEHTRSATIRAYYPVGIAPSSNINRFMFAFVWCVWLWVVCGWCCVFGCPYTSRAH